jgi:hypothetical protein
MSLALSCFATDAFAASAASPFTWGHAAYTYGPLHCKSEACDVVPSCNHAHWAKDIAAFNNATAQTNDDLNIVYAYGGDIEFWPNKTAPDACWATASDDLNQCNVSVYYDPNNKHSAEFYKQADGVNSIVALLDSRMDGWDQIETYNDFDHCKFGDFYPNLVNLSDFALDRLAEDTAKLYCVDDTVDGMQVDLEPYKEPFKVNLGKFIHQMGVHLADENSTNGCRSKIHPHGRTVSYFTFAHNHQEHGGAPLPDPLQKTVAADPSWPFYGKLGENGYFVFSLYDLFPKTADGGFMYNSPQEFGDRMRAEIPFIRATLGPTTHFTLAIPFGASCHEYEKYAPMTGDGCGPACVPQVNSGAVMADYVKEIFAVLTDPAVTKATGGLFCMKDGAATGEGSNFLGLSWWSFSYQMTYPPMKWFDNEFLPGQPPQAALDVVRTNLPLLSDGKTTCIAAETCATVGEKKEGCGCVASTECDGEFVCHRALCTAPVNTVDKVYDFMVKDGKFWNQAKGDHFYLGENKN